MLSISMSTVPLPFRNLRRSRLRSERLLRPRFESSADVSHSKKHNSKPQISRFATWSFSFLLLLSAASSIASGASPLSGVALQGIQVADLTTDRIRFDLHVGGSSQQDIVVRSIAFDGATVNGVPVYLPALSGPFKF